MRLEEVDPKDSAEALGPLPSWPNSREEEPERSACGRSSRVRALRSRSAWRRPAPGLPKLPRKELPARESYLPKTWLRRNYPNGL